MDTKVMFSSEKQDFETPQWLFDRLDKIFKFEKDVAASGANSKCTYLIDEESDGLEVSWRIFAEDNSRCWCNPPYNNCKKWVEKAYKESLDGQIVVMLIPARTDTKAWKEYIFKYATHVIFIYGRLKFSNHENSAPFPSACVVFNGNSYDLSSLEDIGKVVKLN